MTELDLDLVNSEQAMLVLNSLPNVQILNGKSTKEDDDEEEYDNNYMSEQMEEIKEDKNLEEGSNYNSGNKNINSFNNNKDEKENSTMKNIEKSDKKISLGKDSEEMPINEKNINNVVDNPSCKSNKSNITNKSNMTNKSNTTNKSNKSNKNFNNFAFSKIDITNSELLSLLNDSYTDTNSNFIYYLKYLSDLIVSLKNPRYREAKTFYHDLYSQALLEIENKRTTYTKYYYLFQLITTKIKIIKNAFQEILPIILEKFPELKKDNTFSQIMTEFFSSIEDFKVTFETLHNHIKNDGNNSNNNIINDINNSNHNANNNSIENNKLNNKLKEKENTIKNLETTKKQLINSMKEMNNLYQKKIDDLEKENKIMTDKLLQKANVIGNNPTTITYNDSQTTITATEREKLKNLHQITSPIKENDEKSNSSNNYGKKTKTPNRKNIQTSNNTLENNNQDISYNNIYTAPTDLSHSYNKKKNVMSLKALKDFIAELYASKTLYDFKCMENGLPKETLEEHMYTFLNKKYGLKNLIIDFAKNVINGIKIYSKKDSEVLLFGKIMRNEQEEDARFILDKVIESINELLLIYIKNQNPLKSFNEVKKLFEIKKNSELFEEEWKGIIFSIYENKEAEEIQKKIEEFIYKKNENKKNEFINFYKNSRNNQNIFQNKLTRTEKFNMCIVEEDNKILFNDFIKIVLDNHIRFRDKQIKNFVTLFKEVDKNCDGIINEQEFSELVIKFKIFPKENVENEIFKFLEKIDVYDNQKFTFSDCVTFFTNEKIKDENGKEISILQKVCMNNNNIDNINNCHSESIIENNEEQMNKALNDFENGKDGNN